jgi:hypothetical protein
MHDAVGSVYFRLFYLIPYPLLQICILSKPCISFLEKGGFIEGGLRLTAVSSFSGNPFLVKADYCGNKLFTFQIT